jgi:hypothetical protein
VASLAETLLELKREGLPKLVGSSLWKAKTFESLPRKLGGEHLNLEFGFKPLANDMAATAFVISEAQRLINQYMRDAGKQVRRKYRFPPTVVETVELINGSASPVLIGPTNLGLFDINKLNKGKVYRHRKVERSVWFSGAFVYHLPIDPITMRNMDRNVGPLRKLLGVDLTPETVWNLAPWSWAVDWVTNVGDVISNLQSWNNDDMVLRYGYIMEHSKCTDTYYFVGETGLKRSSIRPPVVQFVAETKKRLRATPFGFGLKYGDFTPRQLSIIAALGLSKWK